MKIFRSVFIIGSFFFVVIPACIKNTVTVDYAGTHKSPDLILPKPIVKRGEPFVVSTTSTDPNTIVKWSVRPSDSTTIIPYGNGATIYINLQGAYLITAGFYTPADTIKAFDSTQSTIVVNDSIYAPPGGDYDTIPLAGGELTIVPISTAGGLQFLVKTTKNYNCTSNILAASFWQYIPIPESTLNFYFDSARVAVSKADCGGTQNPATVNFSVLPLTIGNHPINAVLTQTPQQYFEGTLDVTDTSYIFTWPYTSGIIISPLQIKKN